MIVYIRNRKFDLLDGSITIDDTGAKGTSPMEPYDLIDSWCILNGASARGRMDAYKTLTAKNRKVPVLISEISQEIWFPTTSYKSNDCEWIRADQILSLQKVKQDKTRVQFLSGYEMEVRVNYRVLKKQWDVSKNYLELLRDLKKNHV